MCAGIGEEDVSCNQPHACFIAMFPYREQEKSLAKRRLAFRLHAHSGDGHTLGTVIPQMEALLVIVRLARRELGGALNRDDSCDRITRGALALYGMDQVAKAKELLSLISKKERFEISLRRVIRIHF